MKKLFLTLCFCIFALNVFSANKNFWNNENNYKQVLTVESTISYSPSVVNYRYNSDNDYGYYFSDSAQWDYMFNLYPVFQIGTIINYRWLWGLQTFVFSNLYRIAGFNFDIYNLSLRFSVCDLGYSWHKYEWNKSISGRNNQWCVLLSPITASIAYRIKIHKKVHIFINIGYSMQIIFENKIYFPDSKHDTSMFLENVFNMGIGFRFYTRNFK